MFGGVQTLVARFSHLASVLKVAIILAVYFTAAELGVMVGGTIGFAILVCVPTALTILILYVSVVEQQRAMLYLKGVNDGLERRLDEETSTLIEINKNLTQAQRQARIGSWEWDIPQNKIVYSDEMYNVYGILDIKPAEFDATYQGLCKYVHPDDHVMFEETIANSINTGKGFNFDCRIVRPDGVTRVIHWEGSVSKEGDVSRDQLGRATRVFGTAQDITERKRVEEERNRLFNISLDPIYITKFDGYFKDVNPAVERILGYSKEEMLKKHFIDLVHPDDRDSILEELKKLSEGGKTDYFDTRVLCKNGSYKWFLSSIVSLPVEGLIYWVSKDISDIKNTESRLYCTNNVLQNALEGISQFDINGLCISVNNVYANMFGYTSNEMIGMEWRQTVYKEDWQKVTDAYDTMINTGKAEVEARSLRKDGSTFPKRVVMIKAHNSNGEFAGYYDFAFVKDITERKAAEEALSEATKELTKSLREIEQRTGEIVTLNELNELLQSSKNQQEVSDVVALSAKQLFPEWSGAFYKIDASRDIVQTVATWGLLLIGNRKFLPDECWALKLGKPYGVEQEGSGLFCSHLGRILSMSYMCIPIIAHNEIYGILHLQVERDKLNRSGDIKNLQRKRDLAITFAGNIGMTLSNLKMKEILRDQAIRDPLTGLFNRRYMEEWLDGELLEMKRLKHNLSLTMLDIDGFKKLNDNFGHEIGDAVLREVSMLLKNIVRGSDVIARFGGDEAVILMPDASIEKGVKRAERIREATKHINVTQYDNRISPLTVSMGVATYPQHGRDRPALLKSADVALYRAKNLGRDKVMVATD